jgi:hypothetical protein
MISESISILLFTVNVPPLLTVTVPELTMSTFAVTVFVLQITTLSVADGYELASAPPHPAVDHVELEFQFPFVRE